MICHIVTEKKKRDKRQRFNFVSFVSAVQFYDVEFYAVGEELYAIETLKSRPRPKVIPEAIIPRIICLVPE
jgi:hypothetical protein